MIAGSILRLNRLRWKSILAALPFVMLLGYLAWETFYVIRTGQFPLEFPLR